MIGFLIAILSGALMSVQGVFNTQVTKQRTKPNIEEKARLYKPCFFHAQRRESPCEKGPLQNISTGTKANSLSFSVFPASSL